MAHAAFCNEAINQCHEIWLETNQIIKFEPVWNLLKQFLESLQRTHVKGEQVLDVVKLYYSFAVAHLKIVLQ